MRPCRALGPVLEKLAIEAGGAWVLAKVDVDANPMVANALQIQGIPAVKAFKDGRQVAEFTGALPEPQVRRWLEQLGPTPADQAFEDAAAAEERGDSEAALGAYRRVLDLDPGHSAAQRAVVRLELASRSSDIDETELARRAQEDPNDIDAVIGLADLDAARGEIERAFERLIDVVRVADGDARERARRHLLGLLDAVPADDPRAIAARRKLASVLF